MSFFRKKDRFKGRSLRFESLEHRELLSVSPLTYPVESTQGQYGSDINLEANIAAPTIAQENITSSTMKMTWNASTMTGLRTSDGFTIEKLTTSSTGAETWSKVTTVAYSYTIGTGTYSYEFTGLTALTEYTYRISFGSTVLGTGYTERVTAKTDKNEITSEPASSTSIKLSWNFAGKKDTAYEIWMCESGGTMADSGKRVTATGVTKMFTFTVEDLDPATEYDFLIKYYDTSSVLRETQSTTVKTQHTLMIDEATSTTIELYWAKAIGGNVDSYQLQISSSSDSTWKNATSEAVTGQAGDTFDYTTYTKRKISGLKDNETYSFRLRYTIVVDGETVTRYTDPLSYSTPATITAGTVTDTTAVINWSFPNKAGTAYYLQIRTVGGEWSGDYSGANTTGKTYTLKNLEAGTNYEIRIRYTSPEGASATSYSASVEITTAVPTTLDSVTESTATISWDIPNQLANSTVSVQRCDGSLDPKTDSNWKTVATVASGTTTYTSNYLGSDKEYHFRVTYTDTNGDEQHTLYVSARTIGIVTAAESSISSVTLSWDFTPASSNYTVQYVQSENAVGFANVPTAQVTNRGLNGCKITGLEKGKPYYFRIVYTPKGETTTLTSTVTAKTYTVNANVIVTDTTDSSVTLHWAPGSFTGGAKNLDFIIYSFEASDRTGERTWKEVKRVDAATASSSGYTATITDLMADMDYQFKIGYTGSTASTAQSDTVAAKTEAYEVTVTEVSKTTATLEWSFDTYKHTAVSSNSGGDGAGVFTIEKYTGPESPTDADLQNNTNWTLVGSTSSWSYHYYNLDNLTKNTTYYYRVSYAYQTGAPVAGSGNDWNFPQSRKYSQVVEVKTKSDLWTEYVGSNSIKVKWESQTLTGGSSYTVKARVAGTSGWPSNMTVTVASTKVEYTFENLTAETKYEFQVTFNNGAGETAVLTETTGKYIPSIVYKEINVEYAAATIQMGYTGVESNFQLMYRLKTAQDSGTWTNAGVTATTASSTVSMTISTIRPELEYEFKIVYQANGNTIESDVISAAISDDLLPSNVDSDSVVISWLASSFADKRATSNYTVQWREAGTTDWKSGTGTSALTYTVTGLEPNKKYEFRVMYYTVGDAEAYSTLKTVTTAQPKITATAPQVGSIKIAWSFKSSSDGFIVQYKDANGDWQTAATVSSNSAGETTFTTLQNAGGGTVASLELEKEYTLRIAYKTSQSGSDYVYSEEVEVTTLAGLQIVDNSITTTTITIKWDYVTDATYQIHYQEKGTSGWPNKILSIDKNVKEYELKDLKPGVEYEIKLVYTDGIDKSEEITAKTTVAVPAAPSGIIAGDITSNSVTIKWIDNSAFEEDYILEVINSATGVVFFKGSIDARVGSSSSATDYATHELTGLDTNTKYTVKLYATNAEGSSAIATGTFTTTDVARHNKVTSVSVATTPKSVTLSWKITSITDQADPTTFRIEYYYTDADKVSNWYEVTNVTFNFNTESEIWYAQIVDEIKFGAIQGETDGVTVEFENKITYKFRITALGDASGSTVIGDSAAVEKAGKTASITVPSSLSAKSVTLTTATISFKDTDKTLDISEKSYTIKIVQGRYTDWTKVPSDAVITEIELTSENSTLSSTTTTHALTGLLAGTTYSYVVEWEWANETIQSKAANFTTKALPKSTSVKSGYTLTAENTLACQISWTPPKSTTSIPITSDMTIKYVIEVSLTGKAGTFVTLTDSGATTLSTSAKGALYGAIAFSDLAKAIPGGVDITTCKSLYIRVAAEFSQNGTYLGTSYSSNGKITLPKF